MYIEKFGYTVEHHTVKGFLKDHPDGDIYTIRFDNGLGASIICRPFISYGANEGLYELGITDADGDLIYNTPICSNVIGWLNEEEVSSLLKRIECLRRGKRGWYEEKST